MVGRRRAMGGRRYGNFTSIAEKEACLYDHLLKKIQAKDESLIPYKRDFSIQEQSDRKESITYLRHQLDQSNKNALLHRCLAPLLLEKGNLKHAIQHYQCAVSYNPSDLNAWVGLADILFKTEACPDKALEILQHVLEINPQHVLANKNIGAVYAHFARYKEALHHSEQAALLDPMDPMIHRNISKLRYVMGNSIEAVKHNRIAIRLGPGILGVPDKGDAQAYRHLAVQLTATGQRLTGHAHAHYDAYRALSGQRNVLGLSDRTREILIKTRQKGLG